MWFTRVTFNTGVFEVWIGRFRLTGRSKAHEEVVLQVAGVLVVCVGEGS
jgi:hypothetical protein